MGYNTGGKILFASGGQSYVWNDTFATDKSYTTILDTDISWAVGSGYGQFDWAAGAFNGNFKPIHAYQTLSSLPKVDVTVTADLYYYNDGWAITVCGAGVFIGKTPVLNERQGVWLGMTGQTNGAYSIDAYYNNTLIGTCLNTPSIDTWYRAEIKIINTSNVEFRAWLQSGSRPISAQQSYTTGIAYANNVIGVSGRAGNNGANTSGGSRIDNFSVIVDE